MKLISTLFRPRLPFSWVRAAARDTRELAGDLAQAIRVEPDPAEVRATPARERWQRMIAEDFRGRSRQQIRDYLALQYRQRGVHAALTAGLSLGGVAWMIFGPTPIDVLGGWALAVGAGMHTITTLFRMYQIRHRRLSGLREWTRAIRRDPRELLPLPLPAGWDID